jgi:curved DNA-binding protein CbpA
MALKDYYEILELEPSASVPEIKRSFRKLAQQFHPDKNPTDAYAAARFHEIKEAHEVLTNPARKDYYLQKRWYYRSKGKIKKQDAVTPVNILKRSLELEKYVSSLDKFRMDKHGLQQYVLELLSNEMIDTLHQFREPDTVLQIIRSIIRTIDYLPGHYINILIPQLKRLASENEDSNQLIQTYSIKANKKQLREKFSLLFIITIAIFICLLIFLAGG